MYRHAKLVLAIAATAALCVTAAPGFATAANSIKDVLVTNTASSPVPTQAIGTTDVAGSVNVGNLPAVQQVGGTVDVGNLPAVQQVAGTVSTAAQTVKLADVALDAQQRLLTLDVADYGQVRVTMRTNINSCVLAESSLLVFAPFRVAKVPVRAGGDASELIEVPGTEMTIAASDPESCSIFVEVYGRP